MRGRGYKAAGGGWRGCLCTRYNTHDGPKQLRGSCSCTMLDVRRWQTEPAYVRFTMDDGGAWQRLCTKYDVRCTIAKFARGARGSRAGAEGCRKAVRGRSYKATEADGVCLCTKYDVRCTIWEVPALARECGGWCRLCTKYDVRCTIAEFARLARGSGGGENAAYVRCTMDEVRCTTRTTAPSSCEAAAHVRCWMYDVRL